MANERLKLPPLDRLHDLFFYDEEDGELYNRTTRCALSVAGSIASFDTNNGYKSVTINSIRYLAHRIIWKMINGSDPVCDIDHKNTDRKNNKDDNLREATQFHNSRNTRISRRNSSGVKGVHFNSLNRNWRASIMKDRKTYRLGSFKTLEEAEAAVTAARENLHGEFARAA